MSNLTIDQILAECGVQDEVLFEGSEKTASQPSISPVVDMSEVDSMVSLLKEASIEDSSDTEYVVEPRSFQEKLAEAIILNEALAEVNSPEVMFKSAALEAGFPEEEIDLFIEKKAASAGSIGKPLKYAIAATGLTGAGVGGNYLGRKTGRTRGRKEGVTVGRVMQHRADRARLYNRVQALKAKGYRLTRSNAGKTSA